jgi:hypothetical protein
MSKGGYFLVNVLIYWAIVTGINTIDTGSFGTIFALLLGGVMFGLLAFIVEPLLSFFKFPINFWGLLVVGTLLNVIFFTLLSTGILPSIVVFRTGTFGQELSPIPFPIIMLPTKFAVSLLASLIGTIFQIIVRRID